MSNEMPTSALYADEIREKYRQALNDTFLWLFLAPNTVGWAAIWMIGRTDGAETGFEHTFFSALPLAALLICFFELIIAAKNYVLARCLKLEHAEAIAAGRISRPVETSSETSRH